MDAAGVGVGMLPDNASACSPEVTESSSPLWTCGSLRPTITERHQAAIDADFTADGEAVGPGAAVAVAAVDGGGSGGMHALESCQAGPDSNADANTGEWDELPNPLTAAASSTAEFNGKLYDDNAAAVRASFTAPWATAADATAVAAAAAEVEASPPKAVSAATAAASPTSTFALQTPLPQVLYGVSAICMLKLAGELTAAVMAAVLGTATAAAMTALAAALVATAVSAGALGRHLEAPGECCRCRCCCCRVQVGLCVLLCWRYMVPRCADISCLKDGCG